MATTALDRRNFLKVSLLAGGGLALDFSLPLGKADAAAAGADRLNAFVSVAPDGVVTIMAKNPEMGQGIKTSFAMIVADELDADWAQVKVLQADVNPAAYGPQSSGGSLSIQNNWIPMRQAGAAARDMLVRAAAARWRVPADQVTTARGRLMHAASGRSLGYGEVATAAAALTPTEVKTVKLKTPAQFTVIGKPTRQVDSPRIVRGEPLFGLDTRLPGMLYAAFEAAPAFGAKLRSADLAAAQKAPGVKHVIRIEGPGGFDGIVDGVAILATNWWYANEARALLKLDWDLAPAKGASSADYEAGAKQLLDANKGVDYKIYGDAAKGMAAAAKRIKARYAYPFIAHATLEPQNCTAQFKDGRIEIWAPAQLPGPGRELIAKQLGIPPENQTVHITRIGGGFGRRLNNDFMVQAAAIAKQVPGVPVQLLWTRQDDIRRDFYRPAGWHEFEAGIDAKGKLVAFTDHFATFSTDGKSSQRFANLADNHFPAGLVPDLAFTQSYQKVSVPLGALRAPTSNALAFAFQSFLDEVAVAAGRDLPSLCLELCAEDKAIGDADAPDVAPRAFLTSRARGVIQKVIQMSNWSDKPKEPGRAKGFAMYFCHKGYFAEVVEASVKGSEITVHKIWAAGDVGRQIVNPMMAEAQVHSCLLDGLSQALEGQKISFADGAIEQSNFADFKLGRIDRNPQIEVAFITSDYPVTGLGEPALPPVIPALCNAIFAATGKRVRSLPIDLS